MFQESEKEVGCRSYQAALEDAIQRGASVLEAEPLLERHVQTCVSCSQAFDNALLASRLMRHARVGVPEPSEAFVTRVMASIREAGQTMPGAIWRPIEQLASRLALAAAIVLLALSVYLREFAPAPGTAAVNTQTEIGAGLPEPPAAPATQDEVLVSLADNSDAI